MAWSTTLLSSRAPRVARAAAVTLFVVAVHAMVVVPRTAAVEPSGRGLLVIAPPITVQSLTLVEPKVVVPSAPSALNEPIAEARAVVALRDPAPAPAREAARTPSREAPRAPARAAPPLRTVAAAAKPPVAQTVFGPEPPAALPDQPSTASADASLGDPSDTAVAATPPATLPREALLRLPQYLVQLPPSQQLRFKVTRGAASGEGVLTWSQADGRYRAALNVYGHGLPGLAWTSEGEARPGAGVTPSRMVAHRRGKAIAAANFAPDEAKVSFSGPRFEQPFVRGGQDKLTWMLQLAGVFEARSQGTGEAHAAALAAHRETRSIPGDQAAREGDEVVLYVVGPRGSAELWTLRVVGRETLAVGDGTVDSIKLARQAARPYDTDVEIWLDPSRHHLPIKWRQVARGSATPALEWERVAP